MDRTQLLWQKLLKQDYAPPMLTSSIHCSYCRHHDLFNCYEISISQMTMDIFLFTYIFSFLYHSKDFDRTVLCFCCLCLCSVSCTQWCQCLLCLHPVINSWVCVEHVVLLCVIVCVVVFFAIYA